MIHVPAGSSGGALALSFLFVPWFLLFRRRHKTSAYTLDPKGKAGAYEPLLAKYLKLAEVILGLATGSVVLLVGSSALRGTAGKLPWTFASALVLLAFSAIYAIGFMGWLIFCYEYYQQGNAHTGFHYSLSEALAIASLLSFFSGYLWLIWVVTR